jgi:hypothetical protein
MALSGPAALGSRLRTQPVQSSPSAVQPVILPALSDVKLVTQSLRMTTGALWIV